MRKIQILKANNHSKNCVTVAVDMENALLNVDKSNKIIRTNHKSVENHLIILSIHEKSPKFTKQKHSQ